MESLTFFRRSKAISNTFNGTFRQSSKAGNIVVLFQLVITFQTAESNIDLEQIAAIAETITTIGSLIVLLFGSFGKCI